MHIPSVGASLRQRRGPFRASRNMGAICLCAILSWIPELFGEWVSIEKLAKSETLNITTPYHHVISHVLEIGIKDAMDECCRAELQRMSKDAGGLWRLRRMVKHATAGWPRAMPCHVMASRAMPGHIFTCHAIFLRVMPCHKYSVPCRVKALSG